MTTQAEKPEKMTWVTAQVPQDLAEGMKAIAESRERSLSAEIRLALRAHIDAQKPTTGAAA